MKWQDHYALFKLKNEVFDESSVLHGSVFTVSSSTLNAGEEYKNHKPIFAQLTLVPYYIQESCFCFCIDQMCCSKPSPSALCWGRPPRKDSMKVLNSRLKVQRFTMNLLKKPFVCCSRILKDLKLPWPFNKGVHIIYIQGQTGDLPLDIDNVCPCTCTLPQGRDRPYLRRSLEGNAEAHLVQSVWCI